MSVRSILCFLTFSSVLTMTACTSLESGTYETTLISLAGSAVSEVPPDAQDQSFVDENTVVPPGCGLLGVSTHWSDVEIVASGSELEVTTLDSEFEPYEWTVTGNVISGPIQDWELPLGVCVLRFGGKYEGRITSPTSADLTRQIAVEVIDGGCYDLEGICNFDEKWELDMIDD